MSKPKTRTKQSKGKKKRDQVLETADDFLAAGVDFEEAAGKWRAGDAGKSLRFFGRAVETYDRGLQAFPRSLDLAYNKARVQLEIVTHPLLLKKLEISVLSGLEEALSSHRYALSIEPDNADTLFNTAQALTTIAEELTKVNEGATTDVLKLLEEALELQGRCLSVQELRFEESQQQRQSLLDESESEGNVQSTPHPPEQDDDLDSDENKWFSVVEPVTMDTLIDTVLAQLGTLTTLCSILSSSSEAPASPSLAWIEEFSSTLINTKLSAYAQTAEPPRLQEIALAKANFLSSFLEASFHQSNIDANTYKQERDNAFMAPELMLEQYADGIIANAQSLVAFSSALADSPNPPEGYFGSMRWQALSAAVTNLATAAKIPGIESENLVKTHLLRGECSLLLWLLSQAPVSLQTAVDNANQLLKNAEVFFRNASRLSQDEDEKAVAAFRFSVAQMIQQFNANGENVMPSNHERDRQWVTAQFTDMIDEGLLPSNFPQVVGQRQPP